MISNLFLIALLISCAAASITPKVIGNVTKAEFSDAPWIVSLQIEEDDYAFCGATLIKSSNKNEPIKTECHGWVVTAASCLNGVKDPIATLGSIKLKIPEATEIKLNIEDQFINDTIHTTNTTKHGNDLVLIYVTFDIPVDSSEYYSNQTDITCDDIPTLQYESESFNDTFFVSMNASIFGWGLIADDGPLQNDLYATPLPLHTDKECITQIGHGIYNSTTMLCAGGPLFGPNSYDTGGPLVCQYELEGEAGSKTQYQYLCGVASYGPISEMGDHRLPAIFMDIANFAPWITNTITAKETSLGGKL